MRKMMYFLFAVTLAACSNPMEKAYNEETLQEDLKAIKASGKLDTSDTKLLAGYLVLAAIQSNQLKGKTYSEVLNEAKNFKKEREEEEKRQKELAKRAKQEEEARMKKLRETVRVTIFEKSFVKADWEEAFKFKFAIENLSAKEIRVFKGRIEITDLFDKPLKNLSFTYDDPVKSNSDIKKSFYYDYNQFIDGDGLLKSKDLDDLKIAWNPQKVIFKDGSTLE